MNKLNALPTLLLLIWMLFVQYGVAVHASEHLFHAYDESCEVYLNAERLVDAPLATPTIALFNQPAFLFNIVILRHTCHADQPQPHCRAPPVLLS